jgi:2-polyprenyl-3-methyl-5-hydroxy-6-metoxy-1,4-benzoquinol methylase
MIKTENIEKHFDDASKDYDKYKYYNNSVKSSFSVRQELILNYIEKNVSKSSRILDCGCGTGEVLLSIAKKGYVIDGFDISNNMVDISQSKIQKHNIQGVHIWKDNICEFETKQKYDVIIVMGVFQYLTKSLQQQAYQQIKKALKSNGLLIISYGNSIFGLFTFNKHTVEFFKDYIFPLHTWSDTKEVLESNISSLLTYSSKGRKKGKKSETAHGYLSLYLTNPFTIKDELQSYGFKQQSLKFFHFHALPPLIKDRLKFPKEFDINSFAMEQKYTESWLGYFMAYQFLTFSRKVK